MRMIAAVLRGPRQPFIVQELEMADEVLPHEVLVRVVATGLCHTDLSVRDEHLPVPLPAILGHEGAGVVERAGSAVTKVVPGDRVVLAPSSCRECGYCRSAHPSYCRRMIELNTVRPRADGSHPFHDADGKPVGGFFFGQSSFGTYSLTSESSVVKVPDDVPLETLGPLGCGLQTGAGTVLNVLRPCPGEGIAIFGVGPVGLAAVMAAKAAGCTTIVAVDVHESRLELARSLGATHTVNSKQGKPAEYIRDHARPDGVHYSVDTTGRGDVISQAMGALRSMGRCALVGVSSAEKLEIDYAVLSNGRSVEYVVEGDSVPDVFIPRLIELHKAGLFPFDRLVSFYDLGDINRAVADSESGVALKAVLRMPH